MELYNFFIFFMKLSQSRDLDREFNILARVDFDYVFFSHFIFQFLID